MTAPDPRSRPSRGHETPLDGTAATRTDAAVRPHDADALDAWLESVTANGARSIGHGNGRSPHHSTANGSDPNAGDTPLVATARQFHARIGDAEASHATDVPETTLEAIIWERIMSNQLASNQPTTVQQSPRLSIQARPPAQSDGASEGRPVPIVDRFAGGHPAFSAVLAAAVILAIVAIFRVIGAPPSGPTDDPTIGPGPSANSALAAASPFASPSAFDCAGPVSASSGSTSRISDYVPLDPVTDPALIDEANATLTIALECFDPDLPNLPNSIPSLAMTDATRDRIEAVRSMWPVDPWGYGASFDPESTALIDIDHRAKSTKIEPSELVEMPNGRFGAIAYQVSELPELQPNGEPFLGFIAVFLSFRPGEGPSETPLVLTEYFPLCTDESDGTTLCDSATLPNPGHDNGSTPAATPLTSPVASPAAGDDRWLVDAETATCTVDAANPPGAVAEGWVGFAPNAGLLPLSDTSPDNQTAAAEVYLQVQQCGGFDGPAVETLMSDRFAEKLTVLDSDTPPGLTAEETALGRQISDAYVDKDPMSYVIEGAPLPREASSPGYGSASRRVLLPDDVVQLADGRIGGPANVFFRTNDPGGAASYLQPRGFLETGFVIFTAEDGRWVIDDYLLICIGDCDAYWASREAQQGTPVTGGPKAGDLASLGASGSLIVRDETQGQAQAQLLRVPINGGAPEPLPMEGYVSAIRTSLPDVVLLDDAQGNQVAYNASTGITSKTFSTRNIQGIWNVGPYRVIGYSDQVDLLVVDLRTMRLTSLADLADGGIDISDPTFTVQGDESGNLILGVTRADDPGSSSAVAAFIDRDGEHVRILEGWTASGQGERPGAIDPDGASIAYPTYRDGSVVLRTETIAGELIRDHAWSDTSRILRLAFINPTDLIVFSADTNAVSPPPDGTISLIHPDGSNTVVTELGTFSAREDLEGPFISPSGSSLMYATDGEIDGQAVSIWYLLDVHNGGSREIPELRGFATTLGPGEPIVHETVPFVGDSPSINQTDRTDTFAWTTFDLTIGELRQGAALKTVNRHIVDSPDHSVVAGFAPDTPTRRDGSGPEERWSVRAVGNIVVVDGRTNTTYAKPIPGTGTEWVVPTIVLSPDGKHIAFSAYGTDESTSVHRTWVTSRESGTPWIEIGPYMLYDWVVPAQRNQTTVPEAVVPAAAEDGTLLIDNRSGIVSRPLDGSLETTLETYSPLGPPTYTRTTVPDVVMGSDGKTAQNARTGQVLGTSPTKVPS